MEEQQKQGGNKNNGNRRRHGHKPRPNNYTPPYAPEVLAKPLTDLGLSEPTLTALANAKLATVGDVCRRRAVEMYRVQNFGKRNLVELGRALSALGLDFRPEDGPKADEESTPRPKDNTPKQQRQGEQKPNQKQKDKGGAPAGDRQQDKGQNRNAREERSAQPQQRNMGQPNANGGQQQGKNRNKNKNRQFEDITLDQVFPKPKYVRSKPLVAETDPFVKFQRGGKWGFKDKSGREVIPPIYDEVFNFKDDMACVERKQLFGYINRENELVIPYKYECASSFSEGYACVGDDTKCGFINKQGEVVVPFIYDACTAVVNGHTHVKQNGRWGTLDLATNEIIWS